ncbi:MAG TPA: DUF4038 domain-containing protein [Gemmataceae bacterium]|nr:DUF4038 domain-containing protein [Gemmataceae bacterium]
MAALAIFAFTAGPAAAADDSPFEKHGRLRVAKSGTHLEHADGTPFFFLADTTWTGPAFSTEADWELYLKNRKAKGFTAVQFNCASPWRVAPTDAEGRTSYEIRDGKLVPNAAFFDRLEARVKAINKAGLLAVPVLAWAHKKGDAGFDLTEEQVITLVKYELGRFKECHCLYILAGDARYTGAEAERWKRIGRAVFGEFPGLLVTSHPTGMNFPWKDWEDEKWLTVFGYQSGHGDDANTLKWIHSGPPAEYGKRKTFTRPLINLEPPYEDHFGYQSRKPHSAYNVRRAVYWSLLAAPVAGFTYGGHGVWGWNTKPGEIPTDHPETGPAKLWKDALELPGAAQMGQVRKLFESLPWTELRPAQDLVTQTTGKDDPAKFVACAATPDRKVVVAYIPAEINVLFPESVVAGKDRVWFDPRTGKTGPGPLSPWKADEPDWVIILRDK